MEERKNGEAAPSVGREGGMQVCGLMDCVWRKMCVTLNIKLKNYIYVFSIYVGLCLSACNYF